MKRFPEAHRVREIAVAAIADPRTVMRLLRGGRVRGTSRLRIERALRKLDARKSNGTR